MKLNYRAPQHDQANILLRTHVWSVLCLHSNVRDAQFHYLVKQKTPIIISKILIIAFHFIYFNSCTTHVSLLLLFWQIIKSQHIEFGVFFVRLRLQVHVVSNLSACISVAKVAVIAAGSKDTSNNYCDTALIIFSVVVCRCCCQIKLSTATLSAMPAFGNGATFH